MQDRIILLRTVCIVLAMTFEAKLLVSLTEQSINCHFRHIYPHTHQTSVLLPDTATSYSEHGSQSKDEIEQISQQFRMIED